ncbi:hypothetical protein COCC4DRAFT_58820 [Bipolaris maydis ATCC 48331]|uniref:Secreted protein n=1 Tax=Cochliobolus heterostrophus (strain C4 / ATCC 48331 / race T) TaxID=665024 RepID=N4XEP4_COCH4|nr:uncharacterized protein COCC4DRAFT_58820 [Bipolaris maydis ATCC 48331]ENI06998.1 hypothetical protein COCC4DRAFT_58820 [Bipolaris maydis ATCC 48331]
MMMGGWWARFFLGQWPLPLHVQALVAFAFSSPQSARAEDVDSHANKRLGCALQCAERACPLQLENCCPCGFFFCMSDFRHWNACPFPQGATTHAVRFTGNHTRNNKAIACLNPLPWPGSCSSCGERR